jgi:hypothetical protein
MAFLAVKLNSRIINWKRVALPERINYNAKIVNQHSHQHRQCVFYIGVFSRPTGCRTRENTKLFLMMVVPFNIYDFYSKY